jgi:acetylornithine deacetylase
MFRTVSGGSEVRRAVRPLESRVDIEHILEAPPVHLTIVPGYEAVVFPYTTDIPFLTAWGEPLLFGPGSIHVAHTSEEYISIPELHSAVTHYRMIARQLLARLP